MSADSEPKGRSELAAVISIDDTLTSFTYDANGNLDTKTGGWDYDWNFENLMTLAKQNGAQQQAYTYDGLGRRVKVDGAAGSGAWTVSIVSGLDVLFEKDNAGAITKYVYANGLRIAKITSSGAVQYYLGDHLGSTRKVLDSSRNTVFSTDYEPFGKPVAPSGTEAYKYTGERHDDPTGFVYLRARQYDPDLGRFVSADPILGSLGMPQTLNRYAYVVNNPLRHTDATGEFLNIVIGAIAGAIIGGISCTAAQGWSWSNECWIAVGVGGVAGAVAGATFNPALGLFVAEGATASFAATVAAGAISGAVAGAAGYVAEGVLVTASGGSFEWSAQGLGKSVLLGALGGALGAGAGAKLFGLPTREPLKALWSLPESLGSLLGATGSATKTAIATAIGGALVQNLFEGSIDELIEEGLRRVLPFTTPAAPSFVARARTTTVSAEDGEPTSRAGRPTAWVRAIRWYSVGTAWH